MGIDVSRIEQNRHASTNGLLAEGYARENIPGIIWLDGEYDGETEDGIPFDVKACEIIHKRSDKPHARTRVGQVTFRKKQDEELKKKKGVYICCVIDSKQVVSCFVVPAGAIKYENNSITKVLAWTTLQKLASGK